MSKTTPERDEFYAQIHRRMVESGEWDRMLRVLSSKLSEHGWADEMRHHTKECARLMDPPSFRAILEEISSPAQANVPPAIKSEVLKLLRQYVKDQFER